LAARAAKTCISGTVAVTGSHRIAHHGVLPSLAVVARAGRCCAVSIASVYLRISQDYASVGAALDLTLRLGIANTCAHGWCIVVTRTMIAGAHIGRTIGVTSIC
jgi:hypothetical protein